MYASGEASTECLHCPSGKFQLIVIYDQCDNFPHGKWTADSMTGLTECISIPTPFPTPYPTL
jgi:hypothetical protein